MRELYIARLVVNFGESWNYSINFNYSVKQGDFKYDANTNSFRGTEKERGYLIIPKDMEIKPYKNSFEVVQGFREDLSSEDLSNLESCMKDKLIGLLSEYKKLYIKEYNKKVSFIKQSSVA